jgi:hypothetical protein
VRRVTGTIFKVCLLAQTEPGLEQGFVKLWSHEGRRFPAAMNVSFDQLASIPARIQDELRKRSIRWPSSAGEGIVMNTLRTWANRSEFRYVGSVREGTTIYYGTNFGFKDSISAGEYARMLSRFTGQEIRIGTSGTAPRQGSLGEWFARECGRSGMTSYIGPILIAEGYAERGSRFDCIRINGREKGSTPKK